MRILRLHSLLWCAALAVLWLGFSVAHGQLFWSTSRASGSVYAPQILYTGYWKHPGWVNGTLVKSDSPNVRGNIAAVINIGLPYQRELGKLVRAGARAIVVYRDRGDVPGHGMYYLAYNFDERELTVPVVEAYEWFKKGETLWKHFDDPGGVNVSIWPEENKWKKANDISAYQIVWNVVLSAVQMGIIGTGLIRLYSWYCSEAGLGAIGPMCIFLECLSSTIRCAATFVDPYLTFRTMPALPGLVLLTAAFPFQFSCGILLTFYWAETLHSNKISASPFISEYKKSAITTIVLLFVLEIITSTTRTTLPISRFNPAYLSQAFYVIVSIALTISYITCAVQIRNRIKSASSGPPRKSIRNLTIRFTLSTAGYIIFVIVIVNTIWAINYPWGWKIIFNLLFVAGNITGSLQIYSFVPPKSRKVSRSGSVPASQTTTDPDPTDPIDP